MDIKGKVIRILPTETVGSNSFTKRVVHIETESDSKYPQVLAVEFQGERVSLTDKLKDGDTATFHINLRGREWTNPQGEMKVFNTITVWKLDGLESSGGTAPAPATGGGEDGKDLPF